MPVSYVISVASDDSPQNQCDRAFQGGKPSIPPSAPLPHCGLCGAMMTFFFQVGFQGGSDWDEKSLATFACTACAKEEHLIPSMFSGDLKGVEIPGTFLEATYSNYAFLVFPTQEAVPRDEYRPKLVFHRWHLHPVNNPNEAGAKLLGNPVWAIQDETPGSYEGRIKMMFLLQLPTGFQFDKLADAPHQTVFAYLGGKREKPSKKDFYELFLGNPLYLFGTVGLENELVYPIVQK